MNVVEKYLKKYGVKMYDKNTEMNFEYAFEILAEEIKKKFKKEEITKKMEILMEFQYRFGAFVLETTPEKYKRANKEDNKLYSLISEMGFFRYEGKSGALRCALPIRKNYTFFFEAADQAEEWKFGISEENRIKLLFSSQEEKIDIYTEEALNVYERMIKESGFSEILLTEFTDLLSNEVLGENDFTK